MVGFYELIKQIPNHPILVCDYFLGYGVEEELTVVLACKVGKKI